MTHGTLDHVLVAPAGASGAAAQRVELPADRRPPGSRGSEAGLSNARKQMGTMADVVTFASASTSRRTT